MKNFLFILAVMLISSCTKEKSLVIAPSIYSPLVAITVENNTNQNNVVFNYKHAGIDKQVTLTKNEIYTGLIVEKDSLSIKVENYKIDKDKFNYIIRP